MIVWPKEAYVQKAIVRGGESGGTDARAKKIRRWLLLPSASFVVLVVLPRMKTIVCVVKRRRRLAEA